MQRDQDTGKILDDHGIPGELRTGVADTLDAYDQDYGRRGRDHLTEAVARMHYAVKRNYSSINTHGPHAAANGLLVFDIALEEWTNLAHDMEVFAKAEGWSRRVHLHVADRTARADPIVALDHVRDHYSPDDRVAVVIEHP